MFRHFFFFFAFLLSMLSLLFVEAVEVHVNRQNVPLNESFSIIFSTTENVTEQPDFSSLNTDFEILSNSQSYSTSIVNGHVNQERTWTLALMAKRIGILTIPSIQFGQQYSQSETIEVVDTPPNGAASGQAEPIFLETEVLPNNGTYEQTQLVYTVRLYRSVNIAQATLSELKVNEADTIIEKLGKDNEYEHFHADGKRYVVLERKYAVFPQKAGELIFFPIVFEGQIIIGGNSFFNVQTQFKRVSSVEEKVYVKPIPPPFQKSNWLAANALALTGEWSSDPSKMIVGEPITWTLTLTANGSLGSQLPDVALRLPADIRQYPDKPQTSNQVQPEGFVGVKQIKVVLIPSKAGEMTVPAINLKWWDLKADQVREATLPETVLQVTDATVAANMPSVPTAVFASPDEQASAIQVQPLPAWVWYLVASNVFLLCVLVLISFRHLKPSQSKNSVSQFKTICLNGDAKQAEAYLLAWAANLYPEDKPFTLVKIKRFVPEPFQQCLNALYESLYGKKSDWNGESLWQAFKTYKPKNASQSAKVQTQFLKELYPD